MISVALCTWNGEAHLPVQLESLASQTTLADEIVIGDDQSTDGTVEKIREFSQVYQERVDVHVNNERLRSTRNFAAAIARCQGDIIFLCDQDDFWLPQKIETISREFRENSASGFVFSNAQMVDSKMRPLDYELWDAIKFDPGVQQQLLSSDGWKVLLKRWVVTGATMAFQARYKDLILPIPEIWVHDAWIAFLIRAVAPCSLISEPLIQYRQHATQQIGERKKSWYGEYQVARKMSLESFLRLHEMFVLARTRFQERPQYPVESKFLFELDQKILHLEKRIEMRKKSGRSFRAISEFSTGRYGKYSQGWKAFLQDLLIR